MDNKDKMVVFFDCGDTIIDEGSELRRKEGGIVYQADTIPGAVEAVRAIRRAGHKIALVADGYGISFGNMLSAHGLMDCFDAFIVSSEVKAEKPDKRMFQAAMDALSLTEEDKGRIVMIGNNLKRDILGANAFGIRSILLSWSPRYDMTPKNEEEEPTYVVSTPDELPALIESMKPITDR